MIGQQWDVPRYKAWCRASGRLPSLQRMVGQFLGYSIDESAPPALSNEQHADRLMESLMGLGG